MIRATANNKLLHPRFSLSDSTSGSWVEVANYVEGGTIDNTKWHKVSIPIPDLYSEKFELNSVFLLNFARMMGSNPINGCYDISGYVDNPSAYNASCDDPQDYYVDNIILIPANVTMDILGFEYTTERSLIVLASSGMDLDKAKAAIAANSNAFTIKSSTDPNYLLPVAPIKIGFSRTATSAVYQNGQGYAVTEWTFHLVYPIIMNAGEEYVMSGMSVINEIKNDSMLLFRDPEEVSPSIQINQLGFVPDRPKHAYVSNWLGDAGGSVPVDTTVFHVVTSSDTSKIVYTGDLTLRSAGDVQAGSDVWDADFGDFKQPGTYRIWVPCVGLSCPFDIGNNVLKNAAYITSRLLYYKRNIPLIEPYVDSGPGWSLARPSIDHNIDGVFHPIIETYPLNNGENEFEYRKIEPSWYDAGDYGHYMHNLYKIWPSFSTAFDLGSPQDNDLNIPESGNGIPDLLDELDFGMNFALSMQDSDGGVYWRLCKSDVFEALSLLSIHHYLFLTLPGIFIFRFSSL
jgi:hypothetical protein